MLIPEDLPVSDWEDMNTTESSLSMAWDDFVRAVKLFHDPSLVLDTLDGETVALHLFFADRSMMHSTTITFKGPAGDVTVKCALIEMIREIVAIGKEVPRVQGSC